MNKQDKLRIILWNANGLSQHTLELKTFLQNNNIDAALISETHFTDRNYLNIPNYTIYHTNHPDDKAHGGTAVIIKKDIKCIDVNHYRQDYLQATTIQIEDFSGHLTLSAIYCPPKHKNSKTLYFDFLKTLEGRFIAGGDFNAKNTLWGSRITNTKGKNLYDAIIENKSNFLSSGEPTYWPTDMRKRPDLIDFYITKDIKIEQLEITPSFDLSSDHSPILLSYETSPILNYKTHKFYNNYTNWDYFREIMEQSLNIKVPLKSEKEIDSAIAYFNDSIVYATTTSTPIIKMSNSKYKLSQKILEKIREKRKLRQQWQSTRSPDIKKRLNIATKEIKDILKVDKDEKFEKYIASLGATRATNYTLWKACKKIDNAVMHQPPLRTRTNSWAKTPKEKAKILADHFKKTFTNQHNSQDIDNSEFHAHLTNNINIPIKKITSKEIRIAIETKIDVNKSPGYDGITGRILKELPDKATLYLRNIFNSALRMKYFPLPWKVAEIIAIPKPNKDASEASSYRPISLLPSLSKLFEKLILDRLDPILQARNLFPSHQFGFRRKHSTIEQVHRVTNKILSEIDKRNTCVAVYLDVAKAFDSVWHKGLIFKLKQYLPLDYYLLMKSYLANRYFYVKYRDKYSNIQLMEAGVPQGSVLGPVLYVLYTADIPLPASIDMIATFADDTVLLATHKTLEAATNKLQQILNKTLTWFNAWGIQINSGKTIHVVYSNKKVGHKNLTINNSQIPIDTKARYLGMTIDSKLLWKEHITLKRNEVKNRFRQLYWLLGRRSKLSLLNKTLIYKTVIVPIWAYGIEIWGTASKSNINIIQRLQSKILRTITSAPWYVPNEDIHRDLNIDTVAEIIRKRSTNHIIRLMNHTNTDMRQLPSAERANSRRLKRPTPSQLITRII